MYCADVLTGHKMTLMKYLYFHYSTRCTRFFEISFTLNLLTDLARATPPLSNQNTFLYLGLFLDYIS